MAILTLTTAILARCDKHEWLGLNRSRKKISASGMDESRDQPSHDDSSGTSSLRLRSIHLQSKIKTRIARAQIPEKNKVSSNSDDPRY